MNWSSPLLCQRFPEALSLSVVWLDLYFGSWLWHFCVISSALLDEIDLSTSNSIDDDVHARASSPLGLWTSLLLTSLLLSLQLLSPSLRLMRTSEVCTWPFSAFLFCFHLFFNTRSTGVTIGLSLRSCRGCFATRASISVLLLLQLLFLTDVHTSALDLWNLGLFTSGKLRCGSSDSASSKACSSGFSLVSKKSTQRHDHVANLPVETFCAPFLGSITITMSDLATNSTKIASRVLYSFSAYSCQAS